MKRLLLIVVLFFLSTGLAQAQESWPIDPPICIPFCPEPRPPQPEPVNLAVEDTRVQVSIANQIATTRVEQTFRNDSSWAWEGTYLFPLPDGAAISDFTLWIDGQPVAGQLYTEQEARRIYDEIVRQRIDPALLEYVGRGLFQASIFPIEPGQSRQIAFEYRQILAAENGLVDYTFPLQGDYPLENVAITVEIASNDPLKAVYSPSHPVSIQREGDFGAIAGWEAANVRQPTDFNLFYTLSQDEIGVNLLSYQEPGEDGFFTLLLAPPVEAEQVVDKDVIIVLDVSGSMEGAKLAQAKDALRYVLDSLNSRDRFNILAFSTATRAFASQPQAVSTRLEARRFVDGLQAEGSTDINRALLEAIAGADRERPTMLIFLTDGLPTSGTVETPLILNNIEQAANNSLRIFPFGVGDDVDTLLLDSLAQNHRGASAYVRPDQRVDEQVSSFYAKVSSPVLADVKLTVDGVRVEELYPSPLPDLFAGTQLVVTGRYRSGGPATITLSGEVNGQPQQYVYEDITFATGRRTATAFIPKLWATRKVGYLLNQMRLNGENREIIDEVVNLSIRYGIITPYTSFLVEEPELALREEGRSRIVDDEFAEAEAAPMESVSGGAAVDRAVAQNALEEADTAAPSSQAYGDDSYGEPGQPQARPLVTSVGSKTFLWQDGIWTDTAFDSDVISTTQVIFPSPAFFDLLSRFPNSAPYFALGERVTVVLDGTAYATQPGQLSDWETVDSSAILSATVAATTTTTATATATPETNGLPLAGLLVLLLVLGFGVWQQTKQG